MPDSLLLLAFALTLVLNAALILVAIRAMRRGSSDDARDELERVDRIAQAESRPAPRWASPELPPAGRPERWPGEDWSGGSLPSVPETPRRDSHPAPSAARPGSTVQAPAASDPAADDTSADDTSAHSADPANGDADRSTAPTIEPRASDVPTRRRRRSKSKETSVSAAAPPNGPKKSRSTGRRRRFSLPPLDDDGDRVNRSIETFLSSGDPTTTDDAPVPPDRDAGQPPTTIALVAVVEAPGHDRPDVGEPPTAENHAARFEEALVAVEGALRAAARASDRVETASEGTFRVVLASTGELAARAYLRRVRSSVEPLLDELVPRRRLAVATATILGEPLDQADQLAGRRLEAILATQDEGEDDDLDESRAAPD